MSAQIIAKFEMSKDCDNICSRCKYVDSPCELKGRHVDAVVECFMFVKKDEKKGGKG